MAQLCVRNESFWSLIANSELKVAVRRVLRGESYLSPLIAKETLNYIFTNGETYIRERQLTPRQAEILQLLAEGKSLKYVADELSIKMGTVAFHKYRMMRALGIETNADLFGYAIRKHLISP